MSSVGGMRRVIVGRAALSTSTRREHPPAEVLHRVTSRSRMTPHTSRTLRRGEKTVAVRSQPAAITRVNQEGSPRGEGRKRGHAYNDAKRRRATCCWNRTWSACRTSSCGRPTATETGGFRYRKRAFSCYRRGGPDCRNHPFLLPTGLHRMCALRAVNRWRHTLCALTKNWWKGTSTYPSDWMRVWISTSLSKYRSTEKSGISHETAFK